MPNITLPYASPITFVKSKTVLTISFSMLGLFGALQAANAELFYETGSSPSYESNTVTYEPAPAYGVTPSYDNSGTGYDSSINYFTEAYSASRSNDISSLYQYEQMMSGGLFAMYPTYWRLNSDLASLSPNTVAQFVRQYKGSVMAEKLVADYAETKAREHDYGSVRQVANLITNADESERCAIALGYNYGSDAMRALSMKPTVWLNTYKKQRSLCTQLASEMNNNPMISNTDRKERLMRMLRVGNASEVMSLSQSLGTPIDYSELSEIQSDANGFLNRFSNMPFSQKNQYLYLYAIGRIADKSYREAGMQVDFDIRQDDMRPTRLLTDETRRHAYRILGVKRMNYNTDDGFNEEALTWFRKSIGETFNQEEAEDYAQAAIRYSQWDDLIKAIGGMDNAIQQEDMWQYWLARAYEQGGNSGQKGMARQIYQRLSDHHNYYGFLANEKLGKSFNINRAGGSSLPNISSRDADRVMKDANFARAFALYNSDANRSFANREWNWAVQQAIKNQDNKLVLAAAKKAHDIGWLDRSIYAINKAEALNNFAISHPTPYREMVIRYSNQVGIDPAWAYGIIRQESRFVSSARSGAGASGLMQIMPDTGRYIARKLGESYNASYVNSGNTNIRYGTWYMSDIMGKLNNHPVVATAGYNAGPGNAKRWQPVYGTLSADQYVETIAYPETRNYVKRVMENATIYSSLLGNPTQISQRMATVPANY